MCRSTVTGFSILTLSEGSIDFEYYGVRVLGVSLRDLGPSAYAPYNQRGVASTLLLPPPSALLLPPPIFVVAPTFVAGSTFVAAPSLYTSTTAKLLQSAAASNLW